MNTIRSINQIEITTTPGKPLVIIANEGLFGTLEQIPEMYQVQARRTKTKKLCKFITSIILNTDEDIIPHVYLITGYHNLTLDKSGLKNIPLTYLRRNRESLVNQAVQEILTPMRDLKKVIQKRRGRLWISTIIPNGNIDSKIHPEILETLELTRLTANERILRENATRNGSTFHFGGHLLRPRKNKVIASRRLTCFTTTGLSLTGKRLLRRQLLAFIRAKEALTALC